MASIGGLKNGLRFNCALLDFVSGCCVLIADGGHNAACVKQLGHLHSFIGAFAKSAVKLQGAMGELPPAGQLHQGNWSVIATGEDTITISRGNEEIKVKLPTNLLRLARQLRKRFVEIQHILNQAHAIGVHIQRRPYAEYI
jgi:hypothetical protein